MINEMPSKKMRTSENSLLKMAHQNAKDLYEAGALDMATMREFDAMCLPPVKQYTAKQIKGIRMANKASQGVFAAFMNTSISTVQKWEQGQKKPNGISMKMLSLLDDFGIGILGL